jgi:hypothetical protein
MLAGKLPRSPPGIVAEGAKEGGPLALRLTAIRAGARLRRRFFAPAVTLRSRGGVDWAQTAFSGALGLRTGGQRVADMNDGHVDEIQQHSVGGAFRKGASLFQFLGDFDQTIGFRHDIVSL